jgi:hypothetical protein
MRIAAMHQVRPGRHLAVFADIRGSVAADRAAIHAEGDVTGAGRETAGGALGDIGVDGGSNQRPALLGEVEFLFHGGGLLTGQINTVLRGDQHGD